MEKRYSAGITLNAFYQFSKAINESDDDGERQWNHVVQPGDSKKPRASYDIQHRVVSIFTWDLPFGKGRRLDERGRLKDWVPGWMGWGLDADLPVGSASHGKLCGQPI